MSAALLLPFFTAWLVGGLIVCAVWPRARALRADAALILPLGFGAGLGVTSMTFFAASLVARAPALPAAVIDALVAAAAAWIGWRRREDAAEVAAPHVSLRHWLIAMAAAPVLAAAGVAAGRAWAAEPLGGWDGWAIWNMRARFMFRAGPEWIESLRQVPLGWSHLDYPLLVPASVARAWSWIGHEAPGAPGLIGWGLAAASVALLIATAARLRGATVAWLGGLTLAGTPFLVTFAANAHADVPLGFFVLATVALLAAGEKGPGVAALAGAMAGFAAWTKNEGLLFAGVAAAVWSAWGWRRAAQFEIRAFWAGLAVAALPLVYFKMTLAPGNDLVSRDLLGRLGQLWSPERHAQIGSALVRDVVGFGEWRAVPLAALALALLAPGACRLAGRERIGAWVLGLTLAGYYVVYLITPWELAGHLASSLVRLLLQLWPAALLLWCLLAAPPGEAASTAAPIGRRLRFAIGGAGIVFVALVLWRLDRQLAPNEIASARVAGGAASVVAGDGWFGPESHGRDTWRWSRGDASLRVHVEAGSEGARATLRCGLRSLGPRLVVIRVDGKEVWRGPVGEKLVPVLVRDLALGAGVARLEFSSDAPAARESAQPGARELGFALYNVRLE
ncbi:MAG: glycosyltransferase family 39 protein [Opitutaceae bacterium]|nr:glycosyltransferase family 39 protein [Opitutaceae bacterium]